MSRNCLATSRRTTKGMRRGACLQGGASPVFISIVTKSVSPLSPSSRLKTTWLLTRKSCSCFTSDVGTSCNCTSSSSFFLLQSSCDELSLFTSAVLPPLLVVSGSGVNTSTASAHPMGVPSGTLCVNPERLVMTSWARPSAVAETTASSTTSPVSLSIPSCPCTNMG